MIAVIIPVLNEGAHLAETLERVQSNSVSHDTIVVDGGSDDETVAIASRAGARIITAPAPSRSLQMNLGAAEAKSDVLLFLHADTHIQKGSLAQIENALADKRVVGGGFARKFNSDSSFLRLTCALATLRCSLFGLFLGDQAIFVRGYIFDELHGFKEMNPFEDVDFSRRLARAGKTVTLKPAIVSSARRFQKRGPLLMTCRDMWLTCKYISGWKPIPPYVSCSYPERPPRVAESSRPASASNRAAAQTAK